MWKRAVSCILLAAKLAEVMPPNIKDLTKHALGLFSEGELLEQERATFVALGAGNLYTQRTPCDWLRSAISPRSPLRDPKAFVAVMGLANWAALDVEAWREYGYLEITRAAARVTCPDDDDLPLCEAEGVLEYVSKLSALLETPVEPAVVPRHVADRLGIKPENVYMIHVHMSQ
jgi:hypothetical protein